MTSVYALSLLLFAVASCQEATSPPANPPLGDVRNCPVRSPQDDSLPLYQMEVLPGIGFDNLRNLDMGQVHAHNFTTCSISKDGKYLLPDSIFLIPIQESKVEVYAEYFDHWDNYTSMTSSSINVDASFFSFINGKFSSGYSTTKSHMYNDKAKSTRVQIRNKLYSVKIHPGAPLHHVFKSRIFELAASIQNNNTEYAHYLAELIVRDYGTHYTSSMDAGAILSQVDFIKSTSGEDMSKYSSHITASASANFFGKVSLGTTFQHSSSQTSTTDFINNRTYSEVVTIGGPPFTPNMTLTEWEQGIANALVAIDRSGDPLHYVINPTTLPTLPDTTVRSVANFIHKAINRYYKVNTRHGCTNPEAENFNFHANLDDQTCTPPNTNFTFGGIFQQCTVDPTHNTEDLCNGEPEPAAQLNPLTGQYSCPDHYTAVPLHNGSVTHIVQKPVCNEVCSDCGFLGLFTCCHCETVLAPFMSIGHYQTYWCAATPGEQIPQSDGYLFGGYYNSKTSNPVTGSMTCPRFFYPLHMGEDIKICVSTDYEQGYAYAVDFAGFESCSVGNPLAVAGSSASQSPSSWPHTCPHGYTQHLVAVEDGCEINFCVRGGAFKPNSVHAPKLPPFRKHPKYKYNVSDTLVVFGLYGRVWAKNDDGGWSEIDSGSENGRKLLNDLNNSNSESKQKEKELSNGAVAAVSIIGTLLLGVIIVIVIFTGRYAVKKYRKQKKPVGYASINDSSNDQESNPPPSDSPTSAESV